MAVSKVVSDDMHGMNTYEKNSANLEFAPRNLVKALTVARCGLGIHLTGREDETDVCLQG